MTRRTKPKALPPRIGPMPYAERKARDLVKAAYIEAGRHDYAKKYDDPNYRTTALTAFARYIEATE